MVPSRWSALSELSSPESCGGAAGTGGCDGCNGGGGCDGCSGGGGCGCDGEQEASRGASPWVGVAGGGARERNPGVAEWHPGAPVGWNPPRSYAVAPDIAGVDAPTLVNNAGVPRWLEALWDEGGAAPGPATLHIHPGGENDWERWSGSGFVGSRATAGTATAGRRRPNGGTAVPVLITPSGELRSGLGGSNSECGCAAVKAAAQAEVTERTAVLGASCGCKVTTCYFDGTDCECPYDCEPSGGGIANGCGDYNGQPSQTIHGMTPCTVQDWLSENPSVRLPANEDDDDDGFDLPDDPFDFPGVVSSGIGIFLGGVSEAEAAELCYPANGCFTNNSEFSVVATAVGGTYRIFAPHESSVCEPPGINPCAVDDIDFVLVAGQWYKVGGNNLVLGADGTLTGSCACVKSEHNVPNEDCTAAEASRACP